MNTVTIDEPDDQWELHNDSLDVNNVFESSDGHILQCEYDTDVFHFITYYNDNLMCTIVDTGSQVSV